MVFPILIPSKKRPESKLFLQLKSEGIPFNIVIEPQDRSDYRAHSDCLLVLPENNQGLAYSRNFVLNYARDRGFDWFWMLDDDIFKFYKTIGKRNIAISARECFEGAEGLFKDMTSVAQAALEYQQFSWSQSKPLHINGYCDVAVCINVKRTKTIAYRQKVELKEDRDFTLQCLSKGFRTVRTCHFAFSAPQNGSIDGGLFDVYKSGRERQAVDEMCRIWGPSICTPITKKNGRRDVKVNWRFFK